MGRDSVRMRPRAVFLSGMTIMSAVDGSGTGRDGSRIESSDTKGLDEGKVSG